MSGETTILTPAQLAEELAKAHAELVASERARSEIGPLKVLCATKNMELDKAHAKIEELQQALVMEQDECRMAQAELAEMKRRVKEAREWLLAANSNELTRDERGCYNNGMALLGRMV